MDFELPQDVAEFREVTRQIVNNLLVHERAFHETGKVDPIVRKTLVENGYFAMALPEEFGGLGLGALAQAVVQIELARLPPQFWTELRPLMGPGPRTSSTMAARRRRRPCCPAWPMARSASPLP
jgi:acyl-CoA dehydrogenase